VSSSILAYSSCFSFLAYLEELGRFGAVEQQEKKSEDEEGARQCGSFVGGVSHIERARMTRNTSNALVAFLELDRNHGGEQPAVFSATVTLD